MVVEGFVSEGGTVFEFDEIGVVVELGGRVLYSFRFGGVLHTVVVPVGAGAAGLIDGMLSVVKGCGCV